MDFRLTPLPALLFATLALPGSGLQAQEPAAPTAHHPSQAAPEAPSLAVLDEEHVWMHEGLLLAADGIGIEPGELFAALMHDLSIAEVARAHGVLPLDLYAVAVSMEESAILEEVIDEEIAPEDAAEWRDSAAEDVAWMLYEKDPFGLADIAWVLDGASEAFDLDMLALVGRLEDGVSLFDLALEFEIAPSAVSEAAQAFLEMEIETQLLLDEIDPEEADEWKTWNLEWLPDLIHDDTLFETLDQEAWMEEIVALMAGMLAIDPVDVWGHLEDGTSIHDMFEAYEVDFGQAAADFELEAAVVRAMITELEAWLYDEETEDASAEGRADF